MSESPEAIAQGRKDVGLITEAALKSAGQRGLNRLWEVTQTSIATMVVGISMIVSAVLILLAMFRLEPTDNQAAMATTAFMFMSNVAALVIGFYFGRTNHSRIGDKFETGDKQ